MAVSDRKVPEAGRTSPEVNIYKRNSWSKASIWGQLGLHGIMLWVWLAARPPAPDHHPPQSFITVHTA